MGRHQRVGIYTSAELAEILNPLIGNFVNTRPVIDRIIVDTLAGTHICSVGFPTTESAIELAMSNAAIYGTIRTQGQLLDPMFGAVSTPFIASEFPRGRKVVVQGLRTHQVGTLLLGLSSFSLDIPAIQALATQISFAIEAAV